MTTGRGDPDGDGPEADSPLRRSTPAIAAIPRYGCIGSFFKLEAEEPGASFIAVARRHEVSRGLLWNWRQQVRRGTLAVGPMSEFMPVRIVPDPPEVIVVSPTGHPGP